MSANAKAKLTAALFLAMFGIVALAGSFFPAKAGGHGDAGPSASGGGGVSAPLTLTGSTDVVQLTVKGNGTQTYSNPILSIQNSDSTKLLQVTTLNGDATMGVLYFGNIAPAAGNTNYSIRGDGSDLFLNSTNNIELRNLNGIGGRLLFNGSLNLISDTFQYKAGAALDVGLLRSAAAMWQFTDGSTGGGGFLSKKASSIVSTANETNLTLTCLNTQDSFALSATNSGGKQIFCIPGFTSDLTGTHNVMAGSVAGALTSAANNSIYGDQSAPTLTTGSGNVIIGRQADVNASGTSSAVVVGANASGAGASVIIGQGVTSSTTNDLIIRSGDSGVKRVAANVLGPHDGTNAGWFQNTAGRKRLASDFTDNTATLANVTDLTFTVAAGRKYKGTLILKATDSTAAEGIKFDFDGGNATMTSFAAGASVRVGGTSVIGTATSTAIATDLAFSTITGESWIYVDVDFVVNAAGTFIVRAAQNTHAAGTLTLSAPGTSFLMEDMP